MSCWNFAEAVYQLAESDWGDQPALIHAGESLSYREVNIDWEKYPPQERKY